MAINVTTINLTMNGRSYTAVPTEKYERMVKRLGGELPDLPEPDETGLRPARETGRIILARRLITRRVAADWTQEQLARRAAVRVETISRLEGGKHKPRAATILRLDNALKKAGV